MEYASDLVCWGMIAEYGSASDPIYEQCDLPSLNSVYNDLNHISTDCNSNRIDIREYQLINQEQGENYLMLPATAINRS